MEKRENGCDGRVTAWLLTRRQFVARTAATGLALLWPSLSSAVETGPDVLRWQILERVQQHLLPSEEQAPGAKEINALAYLRFVVGDEQMDTTERQFILQGADWLQQLAQQQGKSFLDLDETEREQLLRRIEQSSAGERWLSLLLLYLFEALLTDPVYGGNPAGVGWIWLGHQPGEPRPTAEKRYGVLG